MRVSSTCVSGDDEKSHQKFIKKFNLPFPLLIDADHTAAEAYGAWGEKNMYGRKYMGFIRSAFLIGPDGPEGIVFTITNPAVLNSTATVFARISGGVLRECRAGDNQSAPISLSCVT